MCEEFAQAIKDFLFLLPSVGRRPFGHDFPSEIPILHSTHGNLSKKRMDYCGMRLVVIEFFHS
jgi:hypothetical protein